MSVQQFCSITTLAIFGLVPSALFAGEPVTFHKVDMVCHAAPQIGCGSRAKPLLLQLEQTDPVEEAWLDREGTVVALVWKSGTTSDEQRKLTEQVFSEHQLTATPVTTSEQNELMTYFRRPGRWYRGTDVDELSKEEAGVIADRIIRALQKERIATEANAPALREELQMIFEKKFLSMRNNSELDESAERQLEDQVEAAVVKHTGAENDPRVKVMLQERKQWDPSQDPGCKHRSKGCCKPREGGASSGQDTHGHTSDYVATSRAPMSCKLMSNELFERKNTVLASLRSQVVERQELVNGFAFRFAGTDQVMDELHEFIKTERECCPFFTFDLSVAGDKSAAWLKLTGPEGVKEVIREELELL